MVYETESHSYIIMPSNVGKTTDAGIIWLLLIPCRKLSYAMQSYYVRQKHTYLVFIFSIEPLNNYFLSGRGTTATKYSVFKKHYSFLYLSHLCICKDHVSKPINIFI